MTEQAQSGDELDERTINDVLHDITDEEAAVVALMLRRGGTTWRDEESDGYVYGPSDWEYMRREASEYIAAVDLVRRGLNRETIESVICDGEVVILDD